MRFAGSGDPNGGEVSWPAYEPAEDNYLELGDAIPEPLYRTIAEIIAFAWYLKGKRPAGFVEDPAERDVTPGRPLLAAPRE